MDHKDVSRRIFLMSTAVAVSGCATKGVPSLTRLGYQSPNGKLNLAAIGAGGKGGGDIKETGKGENVIALCDVDWQRAGGTFEAFPKAKQYKDFRDMLDKEPSIEAVTVSTPDHMHAPAAIRAMRMGKHVYVQKPLTHTVYEARLMTETAREYGVKTQMGNQGHSGVGVRELCEMIWDGAIGQVREAHIWTNRPVWPQGILPEWTDGIARPLPEQPIPDWMDWDLWLGPAPYRPYNEGYAPFKWRGWWDFGCGALGDMACHIMDPANWSLHLGNPISVECVYQEEKNDQTAPSKSIIKYRFPERLSLCPIDVYWYDGGLQPDRPEGIAPDVKLGDGNNGSLFIGDEGIITTGEYGGDTRIIYPTDKMADYKQPDPIIPRVPNHYKDWVQACKGGVAACSNFDYAGPFTEVVVLGNLCLHCEGELLWDSENMRITNNHEANKYVTKKYRKGWEL